MKSKEEIVASKISDLLADIRLDHRMIGFYLAYSSDPNMYDRLDSVIEATVLTRQNRQDKLKELILGEFDDII